MRPLKPGDRALRAFRRYRVIAVNVATQSVVLYDEAAAEQTEMGLELFWALPVKLEGSDDRVVVPSQMTLDPDDDEAEDEEDPTGARLTPRQIVEGLVGRIFKRR